jgi:hypothetical protein
MGNGDRAVNNFGVLEPRLTHPQQQQQQQQRTQTCFEAGRDVEW